MVAPWQDGAEIPVLNTCDGDDVSPALSWTGVPDGAVELALVVTDDDADGFFHWVVTDFDPAIGSMLEGEVPQGAVQWPNSFGARQWNGPCPPEGSSHTYRFALHALNQKVGEVTDGTPVDDLLEAIDAFTLGSTTITGTYHAADLTACGEAPRPDRGQSSLIEMPSRWSANFSIGRRAAGRDVLDGRVAGPVALEDLAGDGDLVHLVRAVVDAGGAGGAVHRLERQVGGVAEVPWIWMARSITL